MKRLGVSLVIVVALVSAAAALAADPRAEKERLTAADNARAKRAVVVRSWLPPGWTRTAPSPESGGDIDCPGYDPDLSAFTITGKAESEFKHPSGNVLGSEVTVFPSRAQAIAHFRLTMQPSLARCMRAIWLEEVRISRNSRDFDTSVSARMTSPPRIGERSGGFRVLIRIDPKDVPNVPTGPSSTITLDAVAVQRGRSIGVVGVMVVKQPITGLVPLARAMAARMA